MARKKEFDPDQALAKAMAVFWRLGYENASLELLLREMGIAKQSLYDTYGDKRGLYMKALVYYRRQTNDGLRRLFGAGRPVKEAFAKLLFGLSAESREQHEQGCLLLSANLERDTSDATLTEFLRDNQAEVEGIFREALLRARKAGELSRSADTKALARFFAVTIQGMRAMARLKSDRKSLEQVARVALETLEQ
jgi:TetR/AcrR family transcriptional regulator, transcriptional repressor for nem operon